MQMLRRMHSTFLVSFASSSAYATLGTMLVSIIILPLLEIVFAVLLGHDLGARDVVRTAYAATLVGAGLGVCGGIVGKIVTDRNLGVFQEVHQFRRADVAYWAGSAIMPILLVLPTTITSLGFITWLAGEARAGIAMITALTAVAIAIGVLVGIAMAGVGVALSDPYQGANYASALIPILAGVIVPSSVFPSWLATISWCMPMAGTVRALHAGLAGQPLAPALIIGDLAVSAVWMLIGLGVVTIALRRMRAGHTFSAI